SSPAALIAGVRCPGEVRRVACCASAAARGCAPRLRYGPASDSLGAPDSHNGWYMNGGQVTPIANCYAESWIGSMKRECLNHFACFGLRHFNHIVQTYTNYYNHVRPHQGKDNHPLTMSNDPIPIRAA